MHSGDAVDSARFASGPAGDASPSDHAQAAPPLLADVLMELAEARAREAELFWKVQHLEKKLDETSAQLVRYRELFEYAPDGYLVTDLRGVILEANQTACQLLNTPRSFLFNKPLPLFVVPHERAAFYVRLGELNRNPHAVALWEVAFQPWKQPVKHVALALDVIDNGANQPSTFRWLVRDISVSRQAQEELRDQKQLTGWLLEVAHVLVLMLDVQGRIQFVNPHCLATSGYQRSELLGHAWEEVLLEEAERRRVHIARGQGRLMSSGGIFRGLRTRDGLHRAVEWQYLPLTGLSQQTLACLVVGRDETDLREAQKKVLQMERLAAIGQMAAGLAHESRNALQRSQACLSMLRWRCGDNAQQLDLVDRIQLAQNDLLRLYEGAREYAVPIHLDLQSCHLAGIWRAVWKELRELAPERDALLEEEIEGIDLTCVADRFRLGQVFRNLLENALAACPDPVRVTLVSHDTSLAGAAAVQIVLRDNGPGFSAEQRQHLFEPFHTTKVKGSGLGMSIAKRIVEAHGGQIAVGPGEQPGAEILITLPRRPT